MVLDDCSKTEVLQIYLVFYHPFYKLFHNMIILVETTIKV